MPDIEDIERRLAAAEKSLAEWEEFAERRVRDPKWDIGIKYDLYSHNKGIAHIYDCLKMVSDMLQSHGLRLAEVYYEVFPERTDQDIRVDDQLKQIFPADGLKKDKK
jgi:hypothetical protein